MFENLLKLNADIDAIIDMAKVETCRIEYEAEKIREDAMCQLSVVLNNIKPIMDIIGTKRIEEYFGGATPSVAIDDIGHISFYLCNDVKHNSTYGIGIRVFYKHHDDFWYYDVNKGFGDNFAYGHNSTFKQFIAENIEEITNKMYAKAENLLKKNIENKVTEQRKHQEELKRQFDAIKTTED